MENRKHPHAKPQRSKDDRNELLLKLVKIGATMEIDKIFNHENTKLAKRLEGYKAGKLESSWTPILKAFKLPGFPAFRPPSDITETRHLIMI